MKKNKTNKPITEDLEEDLLTLYMVVDMAYLDGAIPTIDDVRIHYDIIDEAGMMRFVGTMEECCEAMNAATELYQMRHGIVCDKEKESLLVHTSEGFTRTTSA
ncbi:MAG: hypothetical protein J6N95_05740 [Bacilli bacterium]|nr:hypothetical protein [Bacilli bacterium]